MAEVFRAHLVGAEGFRRKVALKRMNPGWASDEAFAAMFIAEARIASLLNHPNVVMVSDFDRDEDGNLFIAMELVDGADLRKLMFALWKRGERLSVGVAVHVACEVLRGLGHAHELTDE